MKLSAPLPVSHSIGTIAPSAMQDTASAGVPGGGMGIRRVCRHVDAGRLGGREGGLHSGRKALGCRRHLAILQPPCQVIVPLVCGRGHLLQRSSHPQARTPHARLCARILACKRAHTTRPVVQGAAIGLERATRATKVRTFMTPFPGVSTGGRG